MRNSDAVNATAAAPDALPLAKPWVAPRSMQLHHRTLRSHNGTAMMLAPELSDVTQAQDMAELHVSAAMQAADALPNNTSNNAGYALAALSNHTTDNTLTSTEANDAANYALKDENDIILTGSIPKRSIQTILLN